MEFIAGNVVSVNDMPIVRTRRGGGGGRKSVLISTVRGLGVNNRQIINCPEGQDYDKWAQNVSSSLYRKVNKTEYAVGFRPHIQRVPNERQIIVSHIPQDSPVA